MEQDSDVAAEITSVLSTKLLQTLRCQRRAPHHGGDPDRFHTNVLTSVGSLKPHDSDGQWRLSGEIQ